MDGQYVGNAATFLIDTVFGLYILLVMLRFVLQWLRADFYNPISQFIVKATQPALKPLRRVIPGIGGIDASALVLLIVLQFAQIWLTTAIIGVSPAALGLAVFAAAELLKLLVNVFFWAIFIQIIISWVNPGLHNPITSLLFTISEPLLRPARNMLPPMSGFDVSPIPVLLGLQLSLMLVVDPIRGAAQHLM